MARVSHRIESTAFHAAMAAASLCIALAIAAPVQAAPRDRNAPHATLTAFKSDAELLRFLKRVKRKPEFRFSAGTADFDVSAGFNGAESYMARGAWGLYGSDSDGEKITNTQETNVDEGDIVKMHGQTLVILRRGRLFTVSVQDGTLKPVDHINAFPPRVDPSADWYDEMLIADGRVIVIGYSYGRGGTEINRFHIDDEGHLEFEDAYHLRSNDYYSSRNYASRLIGTKLVVYSPLALPYGEISSLEWLPALRRWRGNAKAPFERIVSARHVYVPRQLRDADDLDVDVLHTVTSCDLAARVLACEATSVLGATGRTFYVSSSAVYVWAAPAGGSGVTGLPDTFALLYRLPLDGSAPSAISAQGAPTDQFSFREDIDDGVLNVLVRSQGGGDRMWQPESSTAGAVSLLRLPLNAFGDGTDEVAWSSYRSLPMPTNEGSFQNRFVGDYVLYGNGTSWGTPRARKGALVVAAVRQRRVRELMLPHGIDRIEPLGEDAVVVGADEKNLHFQAVELTLGRTPRLGDDYVLPNASQGETRSHAFFFKPDRSRLSSDTASGVLGLPVARAARPGHHQLVENAMAMLFLRRSERKFERLGEMDSHEASMHDDKCKASCVDWYGNARPIFLARRTFALMGYEIVEGELGTRSIREVRRMNFAPR